KARVSVRRQGAVQGFAREPRIPRDLHHAASSGDIPESSGNHFFIAVGFFHDGLQIKQAILFILQMFSSTPVFQRWFFHGCLRSTAAARARALSMSRCWVLLLPPHS